ncbi:polysaccharide deacetylase [Nonlabens sp. YIK11]|uniref:polysaccharide deacetylase family protein n=1 Tax=Nonlabens sp. YIK11 TaxID=1453349 RepID=UPI00070774C6|nr:polysaccharide deacetylase family protein [Nonlabens sp. YIK11]KQC32587.1 polysaccharide deacetylase [Nonlabens sp. YIK11]
MWYPDRIPDWLSGLFPKYHWHGDRNKSQVYLTFDDGPTPMVTHFVLEQLERFGFKATFFLIGDRAQRFPDLKKEVLDAGHSIGNHTYHHLNSWKVSSEMYLKDIAFAKANTSNSLFRPPYGRIHRKVAQQLVADGYKIVLWDVLSGDFDTNRSPGRSLKSLKRHTRNGSVVVFHDSEKAFPVLKEVLPAYLEWLQEQQFECLPIS